MPLCTWNGARSHPLWVRAVVRFLGPLIEPELLRCLLVGSPVIDGGNGRGLNPDGREVVRLRVVAALESGALRMYRQAAETFRLSERSVGSSWRTCRAGGREALAVKRARRSGAPELIRGQERAVLFQAMTPECAEPS